MDTLSVTSYYTYLNRENNVKANWPSWLVFELLSNHGAQVLEVHANSPNRNASLLRWLLSQPTPS